jgi:hypothetical protein
MLILFYGEGLLSPRKALINMVSTVDRIKGAGSMKFFVKEKKSDDERECRK